jgi:hypothetical protein
MEGGTMNWSKAILAGVVAGIVLTIADFVMHVVILGDTYMSYPEVFRQDDAGVHHFFLVGIMVAITAAILFGKTRSSWADGIKGGLTFGFFLGLVLFFTRFYQSLTLEGFPYYLNWCTGGSALIACVIMGAVLGLMMKKD